MKHFTIDAVWRLIQRAPNKLPMDRRPVPMPGKRWPTRIAWQLTMKEKKLLSVQPAKFRTRTLASSTYVGKPNRYRAMQVQKFIQLQGHPYRTVEGWAAEFDGNGLIAYRIFPPGGSPVGIHSTAFFAYHPHSPDSDIIGAFARPVHVKYIGGMRLYSEKKKLSVEAVDAYYKWYYEQFKKKLKRPKAVASAVIAGEKVEAEEDA